MSNQYFVSLGDVAEAALENHRRYQTRISFVDALKQLRGSDKVLSVPKKYHGAVRFLQTEEFRRHAYAAMVPLAPILDDIDPVSIRERNIFFGQQDVFAMVHLPYIEADIHVHDYFEINYVYSGSCYQIFATEKKHFYKGDLVIIAPQSPHCVLVDEESFVLSISIRQSTFNQTFWQLLGSNDMLSAFFKHSLFGKDVNNYISFSLEEPRDYEELIQEIYDEANSDAEYSNNICINLMNIFFARLLRRFGNSVHLYDMGKTAAFNSDFPMIMKYVQYNYNTVDLSVLSSVFHYSEVYISKMFRQQLNQKFSLVVQNLKLLHAKEYLENSSYKIEEIAELVGYDSADYLSRIFKKVYGVTPSEYRKSFR